MVMYAISGCLVWIEISVPRVTILVEKIPGAIFQGGGLQSTTFVIIYKNVRLGL